MAGNGAPSLWQGLCSWQRLALKRPRSLEGVPAAKGAFHPGAGRISCRHADGVPGSMQRASTSYADRRTKKKRKDRFIRAALAKMLNAEHTG